MGERVAGKGAKWSIGSQWQRWDPHVHAPGTLRNDQFGQDWNGYIRRIEAASPAPVALGVTDYFCLRGYKAVRARMVEGALSSIPLVFPNVELRLTIETKGRQGINLHLLVCPDDLDHVARAEEALGRLSFRFQNQIFPCTEDGLRRLGHVHRGGQGVADDSALTEGANQFKVELSDVRALFDDAWVKANVLVAVAAGDDGLSGISGDASFHAQREELGRFANIVFSSNAKDRKYWLGDHPDFERNGQTPKPCLHGSDAHSLDAVLEPPLARRCWIKAAATFEGLRQSIVEPERRVHIGEAPPAGPRPSETLRRMRLRGANWLDNEVVDLNGGLVTVIGARGSGKTALADLLAFGADALETEPGPASFIAKAGQHLSGIEVELEWMDGSVESRRLGSAAASFVSLEPRVRYLSQQFVERLCAPASLGEPLVEEIERVVFSAIREEDRFECTNFDELRQLQVEGPRAEQQSLREVIRNRTVEISNEHALQRSVPALKIRLQASERERDALEKELKAVPLKIDPEKLNAHRAASGSLQSLKTAVASAERNAKELRDLLAELQRQARTANEQLLSLKARFPTLAEQVPWKQIKVSFPTDVLSTLEALEKDVRNESSNLRRFGTKTPPADSSELGGLVALESAFEKATTELGADQAKVALRAELEKRLQVAQQVETKVKNDFVHAEMAPNRQKEARDSRLEAYEGVFQSLTEEERTLQDLYSPLQRRMESDQRVSKLSFSVMRVVDIDAWATRGEGLLDLRKPPFQRRGQLAEVARKALAPAWRSGSPSDVRAAMTTFLAEYGSDAAGALAQNVTPLQLGEWLFSTEHVRVQYGIQYEGVDVSNLSPGTRGVVLLALYLGLDESDRRPLIIDQPEENLDPRSIYTELAPYFRVAAQRRQIIMVTHNANLVVNTDSDQVIVAEAERRSAKDLPQVRYVAGGLEDAEIRRNVCRLLEGGEDAFNKRGRRYGAATAR